MANSRYPEQCDLTEPFEFYGKWWRAGSDQNEGVNGCLSYTPSYGVQLQLYESLPYEASPFNPFPDETGTIWGNIIAFAGRPVPASLFDPINTNRPNDPTQLKPSNHDIYHVQSALLGVHAQSSKEVSTAEVELSVVDLESFLGRTGVKILNEKEGQCGLILDPIKPIELTLRDPQASISIQRKESYNGNRSTHTHCLSYRDVIVLRTKDPKNFPEYLKLISQLENFLALCSRKGVFPRRIRALLTSGTELAWFAERTGKLWRQIDNDWIVTLGEIGTTTFEDAINNWFSIENKLGFTSNVLFGELTAPSTYQDARFFHFAACLEGIHRELIRPNLGKYLPDDQYKNVCDAIDKSIDSSLPERLQTEIRSKVRNANNHFFAERLDELFNMLSTESQAMLAEEPQRFLSALKHSRNKLAHVYDGGNGETFEGVQYAHANASIHAWIVIVLLKLCGIPEDTITAKHAFTELLPWGPFRFEK